MSDGIDDKKGKVGGVTGTNTTKNIDKAAGVSEVQEVKKTESVTGAGRAGAVGRRKLTRTMTASERDTLFSMIDEEADKLFDKSGMSEETKEVARKAVRMAVDAATVDED